MSDFSDDLLRAAATLYARRKGQKGPLKAAFVRRSISTSYYAIFHFMLHECATRIVGTTGDLRQRRRVFVRTLSHSGLTITFGKLKDANIEKSVEILFRLPNTPVGPVTTPAFVRGLATAFIDAKSKREDADYNLNEPFSETDARQLRRRVVRAVKDWKQATTAADRDTKHAVATLISLRGRLRDQ